MKQSIGLALALFFLAQNAFAGLSELIEQNVKDATTFYEQLLLETEQRKEAPRLWIHVRSEDQKEAVMDVLGWLETIDLGGRTVELHPIQLVDHGPGASQLRFFKKQDEDEAELLLLELRNALPMLQLIDLSRRYRGIGWIKPGHYELWLASGVSQLKAP